MEPSIARRGENSLKRVTTSLKCVLGCDVRRGRRASRLGLTSLQDLSSTRSVPSIATESMANRNSLPHVIAIHFALQRKTAAVPSPSHASQPAFMDIPSWMRRKSRCGRFSNALHPPVCRKWRSSSAASLRGTGRCMRI